MQVPEIWKAIAGPVEFASTAGGTCAFWRDLYRTVSQISGQRTIGEAAGGTGNARSIGSLDERPPAVNQRPPQGFLTRGLVGSGGAKLL